MTENETEETAAEEVEESSDTTAKNSKSFSHTVRHKDRGTVTIKNYSMAKAIKLNCSECEGFESDPEQCPDKLCPFWPFRGNSQANRKRVVYRAPSPEQVKKMRDALAKSRAAKNGDTTQSNI